MQIRNVRSTAQQNAKRDIAAVKEMAKTRGEAYLEYAKKYFSRGDLRNAKATAIEGRRLCQGPFYLAVQDELDDLIRKVHAAEATSLQPTETTKNGVV
jgi:hypothetical protein